MDTQKAPAKRTLLDRIEAKPAKDTRPEWVRRAQERRLPAKELSL